MLGNRWAYGVDFAPLFPRMFLCRLRRLPQWKKAWLYLTAFIYPRGKAISLGNHFGGEESVWDGCYDKLNVWALEKSAVRLAAFGSWGSREWQGRRGRLCQEENMALYTLQSFMLDVMLSQEASCLLDLSPCPSVAAIPFRVGQGPGSYLVALTGLEHRFACLPNGWIKGLHT